MLLASGMAQRVLRCALPLNSLYGKNKELQNDFSASLRKIQHKGGLLQDLQNAGTPVFAARPPDAPPPVQ
jgi:hypothetical protein